MPDSGGMQISADSLGTERLLLRRFTPADVDLLHGLQGDARVMRYINEPKTRAETESLLCESIIPYYDEHPGLGVWATLERASGACIGLHLLNHIRGETHIQVGYLLFPEYWGFGYATEMCRRIVRYGFEVLELARITGITHLEHVASQQVLLKSGLRRNGERAFQDPAYRGLSLAWFERDAPSWLTEHGG